MIKQQNLEIASRKRRIVAFFIDFFTNSFLVLFLGFLMFGLPFFKKSVFINHSNSLILLCLLWVFLFFLKDCFNGESLGKRVMGIVVRDTFNHQLTPSYNRLFIRNIFLLILPIEFLILLTNKQKRRLGDSSMQTVVLKSQAKTKVFPIIISLSVLFISIILSSVILLTSLMKSSGAYKVSIQNIKKNERIIHKVGGIKEFGFMPTGNIQISNGYGNADLSIKVIGNSKSIYVKTHLEKKPKKNWELIEISE